MLHDPEVTSSLREALAQSANLARDVEDHARRGDELALDIWNQTCRYLAIACISAVHWLDPQMIVIGGGMAAAGSSCCNPCAGTLKKIIGKWIRPPLPSVVPNWAMMPVLLVRQL